MVTSCFFCQNLLSDYIEGQLSAQRSDEIAKHLAGCESCTTVHSELKLTIQRLSEFPSRQMSHETLLRFAEASQANLGEGNWRLKASKWAMLSSVPVLLLISSLYLFPGLFPWFTSWRQSPSAGQFTRYFPLYQGATEILDEQASWLFGHELASGSLWEEGGLSPEEFEKTFQIRDKGGENP